MMTIVAFFANIRCAVKGLFLAVVRTPPPIDDAEGLRVFLAERMAKLAGEMTIKYSQKRLGRGHFRLCQDAEYARELVNCQIALHAAIAADCASMISQHLQLSDIPETLRRLMREIHQSYAATAPPADNQTGNKETPAPINTGEQPPARLGDDCFRIGGGVRELSDKTGALLFAQMPLTEDLLPGNKQIFRGQLRTAYITLMHQFQTRADIAKLKAALR